MNVTVCRKEHFNAAHRLFNPEWDDEKNEKIFGKCNNPNYHGHNYDLVVRVKGEIDPDTGYVIDINDLKNIIKTEILDAFDHKNLNLDVPEFRKLNPTAENIAVVIWEKLREKIDLKQQLSIQLFETERNFVEYDGK
jgi:6-pyruvoyltetrahydropterin/6-carboxytetrahydropterin synthase